MRKLVKGVTVEPPVLLNARTLCIMEASCGVTYG